MAEDGMGEGRGRSTMTLGMQTNLSFLAQSEMTEAGMGEGSGRNKVTVGTQTNLSFSSSTQLLPRIPNQITLDEITPRLGWRDLHVLSSVSSSWLEAIRSHRVYDARVGANSTETLVVHIHSYNTTNAIALYSTTDKRCFELPPTPHLDNKLPPSCQCISLDGKVYVLGGFVPGGPYEGGTTEVFVFDVAGQRQWKQCASMEWARQEFGCGVLDGKIYAFGGDGDCQPVCESEVYDPKVDEWSPIMPMPSWRFKHQVATIGEELFVYGGQFYEPDFFDWDANGPHIDLDDDDEVEYYNRHNGAHVHPRDLVEYNANGTHTGLLDGHIHAALFLEVYHPAKNEWRIVEPFGRNEYQNFFAAKGKLYEMTRFGIEVYDMEQKSWANRHKNSFAGWRRSVLVSTHATLVVNDELFVRVHLQSSRRPNNGSRLLPSETWRLLHSEGFDSKKNEIIWRKTRCKSSCDFDCETTCTILL